MRAWGTGMAGKALSVVVILAGLAAGMVWWTGRDTAPAVASAEDIARAATLRPDSPALSAIYERSCVSCHAVPDAQAPLAGHRAAWRLRLKARGADGLVQSARDGFGNMPAMGLCNDCTEAELRGLIAFMSGAEAM